jgi:hypothetical protein
MSHPWDGEDLAMRTLIAALHDRGSLSEAILWRTTTLEHASEPLYLAGRWQQAPDVKPNPDGTLPTSAILLSSTAYVVVYEDAPPFHADDNLAERIESLAPTHLIDIGPRGGIRRLRVGR